MPTLKNAFLSIYSEFWLLLPKLLTAIVIFFIFYLLARLTRKIVKTTMARFSTEGHVDLIVGQVSYVTILVIGIVAALSSSRLANVTALVTSLGLAGFAFGFALRDVLGNFLAGILILAQRPFTLGDTIELAGYQGQVVNIRVKDTVIKAKNGNLVFIPNSTVFASVIVNHSTSKEKLVSCELILPLKTNLTDFFQQVKAALTEMKGILPKPEKIVLEQTEADKYRVTVEYWVNQRAVDPEASKSELIQNLNKVMVK